MRVVAAGAIIIATTFGGPSTLSNASVVAAPARTPQPIGVDAVEVVLSFGDSLGELHEALSYEESDRDVARVERACANVVAAWPRLTDTVGEAETALLVAAFSMVDACRQGFAATLDVGAFEIVDGDYLTYRELSFDFAD